MLRSSSKIAIPNIETFDKSELKTLRGKLLFMDFQGTDHDGGV